MLKSQTKMLDKHMRQIILVFPIVVKLEKMCLCASCTLCCCYCCTFCCKTAQKEKHIRNTLNKESKKSCGVIQL